MENKIDIDTVISFRRQGFLWSEIAKRLGVKTNRIKRICLSKRYQKRSDEWIQDSREAMDDVFRHYAVECAKNSQLLLDKVLEMTESESPRVQIEGLKLAYSMIKDSRAMVLSDRLTQVEDQLASLEDD